MDQRTRVFAGIIPAIYLGASLFGCAVDRMSVAPRRVLPIPAATQTRLAMPQPVVERDLVRIGHDGELAIWRGRLVAGTGDGAESLSFHLVIPDQATGEFVVALPILAGGKELMWWVATDLAQRGFTVAWPDRIASTLKPGQSEQDLDRLFTRSAIQARILLAWAREQPSVDPESLGLVGISLGSMIGAAVLATEPDVRGALCLAGADLPDMILTSGEPRADRWRKWRSIEGATPRAEIERALDTALLSDPGLLGAYIETSRVLLVAARFDEVVPTRHQDLLWESLGRPKRVRWPLGHYTAALALPLVLNDVARFLRHG